MFCQQLIKSQIRAIAYVRKEGARIFVEDLAQRQQCLASWILDASALQAVQVWGLILPLVASATSRFVDRLPMCELGCNSITWVITSTTVGTVLGTLRLLR